MPVLTQLQYRLICRMDLNMLFFFFAILIFNPKWRFCKGYNRCMMANFQNGLISLVFSISSSVFLHRTWTLMMKTNISISGLDLCSFAKYANLRRGTCVRCCFLSCPMRKATITLHLRVSLNVLCSFFPFSCWAAPYSQRYQDSESL